jgi:hypothetical protein
MIWNLPPRIKIHEALGCLADGRLELSADRKSAKVYSSSRNKFYTVSHDPARRAIMANDNGSFWQGYLGYPALAFLMAIGELAYDPVIAEMLKDIAWKDINVKFKNDFEKTEQYILANLDEDSQTRLRSEVERIFEVLKRMKWEILGERTKPPTGY